MDISPKVALLKSVRAERGNIINLCGEAVDNSLDANASHVEITISEDTIRFNDDGIGVTIERFPSIFSLGDHAAMASTQIGRFGIGIKSQAINIADCIEVQSTSSQGCYYAIVNWREVLKSGEWKIADPTRLPSAVGAPTGTEITLTHLRRIQRYTTTSLVDEIAQRFYPALVEGRAITVNGMSVPVIAEPPMTDIVERSLVLSDGRRAHIRAGLLTEPGKLNRVHVAYGPRVIMPGKPFGCGDYNGLSNMFARIQLSGGPWHLDRYKNGLTDEDEREELEEATLEVLRPILEKCSKSSMSARIAAIMGLVNDLLPDDIAAARPQKVTEEPPRKGAKKGKTGTVDPAKADPSDGPAKSKRIPKDRLLITAEGRDDEHGIGWFERGRTHRVHLSQDNPTIASLLNLRDNMTIAQSLRTIALMLFEEGIHEGKLPPSPLGVRVAHHLAIAESSKDEKAA
jgi:hypothetical protein